MLVTSSMTFNRTLSEVSWTNDLEWDSAHRRFHRCGILVLFFFGERRWINLLLREDIWRGDSVEVFAVFCQLWEDAGYEVLGWTWQGWWIEQKTHWKTPQDNFLSSYYCGLEGKQDHFLIRMKLQFSILFLLSDWALWWNWRHLDD